MLFVYRFVPQSKSIQSLRRLALIVHRIARSVPLRLFAKFVILATLFKRMVLAKKLYVDQERFRTFQETASVSSLDTSMTKLDIPKKTR